jgi:putative peptidoglycan lipid II flippase
VDGGTTAAMAHVTAPHAGTGWTGSLVTLTTAALVGAAGYAAAARLLHLSELREIVTATRASVRAA